MQGVMFSNPHYRHYVNILVVIFTCWLHTRVSRGGGGVRLGGGAGQGGDSSTPDSPGVRREGGGRREVPHIPQTNTEPSVRTVVTGHSQD